MLTEARLPRFPARHFFCSLLVKGVNRAVRPVYSRNQRRKAFRVSQMAVLSEYATSSHLPDFSDVLVHRRLARLEGQYLVCCSTICSVGVDILMIILSGSSKPDDWDANIIRSYSSGDSNQPKPGDASATHLSTTTDGRRTCSPASSPEFRKRSRRRSFR